MNKQDTLLLRQQLEARAIDYWWEVDMRDGVHAPDYYTDDAVFGTSVREYRGRAAIAAFYATRHGRPARVSLHLMQNFAIEPETQDRVRCRYFLSLFAADGEAVLPSRPPTMIARVDEIAVRQVDDAWLYALRKVQPLFRDDSPTRG
jgi:hypothetical protein